MMELLAFFEERRPKNKKTNKMSSDKGSVPDPKSCKANALHSLFTQYWCSSV